MTEVLPTLMSPRNTTLQRVSQRLVVSSVCILQISRNPIVGMEEEPLSVEAFLFVAILTTYVLASQIIQQKKVLYIHESTLALLLGLTTALISRYLFQTEIHFSENLFFNLILPPIVCSAGFCVRKSFFFNHLVAITFLGILATLLTFAVLALFLFFINPYIFQALTPSQILLISCILCATDSVAAASLAKSKSNPALNSVISGESIFNGAVAIILHSTVSDIPNDDYNHSGTLILKVIVWFSYDFILSLTLGVLSGFSLCIVFKHIETFKRFPIREASLIILNGYLTYLAGELLGLSGIISLFTCSVILGYYAFPNLSKESQRGTGLAFESVKYIAEAFVFAYMGASILSVDEQWTALAMGLLIILVLFVLRFLLISMLPFLYRLFSFKMPLQLKELKILWYAGMIRGVIAFALSSHRNNSHSKFVRSVVLVIVILTTFVGTTFLKPYATMVGFLQNQVRGQKQGEDKYQRVQKEPDSERSKSMILNAQEPQRLKQKSRLKIFEEIYIQPYFSRRTLDLKDEIQMKVES